MNGGDLTAQVLRNHGVDHLFTLCGGHISPILVSAKKQGIRVIDVRDEAAAVFAADAMARLTGIPGVAAVTAGPGLTTTVTAVKNAQLAQSPLILLGGATATFSKGAVRCRISTSCLDETACQRAMRITRLRDLVPQLEAAFAVARTDVPRRCLSNCRSICSTTKTWCATGIGKRAARARRRDFPRAPGNGTCDGT
jgi:thiamine pyrophosphate-dependent acetolactate synthase large subunit-like protein